MITVLSRPTRQHRSIVAAGGFSPSSIAGLKLWLKADALALSDGDPVATWTDSSGGGLDATQATSSKRPVFKASILNGLPVVRFDGTDDFLSGTPTGFPTGTAARTSFVVFQVSAYKNQDPFAYGSNVLNGAWIHILSAAGHISLQRIGNDLIDPTVHATNTPYVACATVDGSNNAELFVNAVSRATSTSAASLSASSVYNVGAYDIGSQNYLGGDLAEVLLYDSFLSSTDRGNVESYLSTKWGLGF